MAESGTGVKRARFWRKLLRLTRGRVTVLRTLRVILAEEDDPDERVVIGAILEQMQGGASLSDALKACQGAFSPSVVELVATAEKTGAWDEILIEIAEGLEEGTFS